MQPKEGLSAAPAARERATAEGNAIVAQHDLLDAPRDGLDDARDVVQRHRGVGQAQLAETTLSAQEVTAETPQLWAVGHIDDLHCPGSREESVRQLC